MNKRQRKKAIKQHCQRVIDKSLMTQYMMGIYAIVNKYSNYSKHGKGYIL